MKSSLLLVFLLFSMLLNAQTFEWAKHFGNVNNEIGQSIATDDAGNVYITGYFIGTVDFDPGPGIVSLTSNSGGNDAFVTKFDSDGNLIWAIGFGGALDESPNGIEVDQLGNIYLTGTYRGTTDLDPGPGNANFTSNGNNDVFVSKLDASGNYVWAFSIGSAGDEKSNDITLDALGNIHITGQYLGTMDFDPSTGSNIIPASSSGDIFVAKYDNNGNHLWAAGFGGTSIDEGESIAVDNLGNVYTVGDFRGTVDFDPGTSSVDLTALGSYDVFISKLDASGNFLWVKQIGGTDNDRARSCALDASNSIYIAGYFNGTADFDPGAGNANLTSAGSGDSYVLKLDELGNYNWAKRFGNTNFDIIYGITADNENLYVVGSFDGTVDFDPGAGTANQTGGGSIDLFINTLDFAGNYEWSAVLGGTGQDFGQAIANDGFGNIYSTGGFQGSVNFDPFGGTTNLTATGGYDVFIHRISQCITTFGTDVQTACDSYTWIDGNTYTASNNTATFTLPNAAGCDSVVTLDLTINNSTTGTDVQTACDSYTWIDGNTYTSSNNTATFTLPNAAGCDSVVTLDLTINNSTTGTDVQTACDSYTWIDGNTYTASNNTATFTLPNAAGCDSVVTLDLTINNSTTGTDVQTACGSYTWIDGNTYTSSNNTATFTVTNAAGCDSIVTLDLSINTVNVNTTNNSPTLSADQSGATYQWIDCNNNDTPISGATNQSYTPTVNGSYAVIVTDNGCTDTSDCMLVDNVNLIENTFDKFIVFPNPTNGQLEIDLGDKQNEVNVSIYNALGAVVKQGIYYSVQSIQMNIEGNPGVYLVEIQTRNTIELFRVIKR